jgi:putative DNA primase/helicase
VLHDFPFVSQSDRAHAVALMLLPFVRDLIDGPTPLHDIEAPTPGSGKGLLTRCLLMPGVGGRPAVVSAPAGEEEWQKSLFSHLRASPQVIVIDNVGSKVTSSALCMALTEGEYSARLLGVSESATVPVSTVWAMTANNPKFSDEVARRTIRIRVDAQVERPEDRGGFRHADLGAWCAGHRAELVQACCVMVQGWVKAGMPEAILTRPLGSFEHWHSVMGGLLDYLGVPGLLENKAEFLAAGDDEADAWSHLVAYMRTDLAGEWTSGQLAEVVTEQGIAIELGNSGNRALMMGRELAKQRDRWHNGYQIQKRMLNGKSWWRLVGMPNL